MVSNRIQKWLFVVVLSLSTCAVQAAEKLVIDLEMDSDLLSLTHNIDGMLFPPTMNFSTNRGGNISELFKVDVLKNHLAASALIRIDGEIVGYATEQESLIADAATGHPIAESAWLITLESPGLKGVLAVTQQEDAGPVFGLAGEVMQNPDGEWQDEFQRFLSSSNSPTVQLATGDLAVYQGGRFEEYNYLNPADYKNYGRFRARIQFVIYPVE
jgi:hypothetical protein